MGDAWDTPMQALIQARNPCEQQDLTCLVTFLCLTAHNDSVKLMPSLLELLHTSLLGRWTITASRLLGLGCWTLVFTLLVLAHQRLQLRAGVASRALPLLWLFLFSLGAGLERFATAFAIHRALPALCSVAAAGLLWVPLPPGLARHRLPLLALACLLSLFSFANGGWLFPLVAFSLALQRNRQWQVIAAVGMVSLAPYLALFKWKHVAAMQASVDPSANSGLSFLLQFSLWPLQQTLGAVHPADGLVALPLALLLGWGLVRQSAEPTGLPTSAEPWQPPSPLGFYGFLLLTYLPVPLLITLQRGYSAMQPRYFIESALFSGAVAGLVVVLLQWPALRRGRSWLAGTTVALLALNSARLLRLQISGAPLAGPQGLTCLQTSAGPITPATIRRCGVDREFVKWQVRRDPAWRTAYAKGLNAVLRPDELRPTRQR